jgi:hypothetical protein
VEGGWEGEDLRLKESKGSAGWQSGGEVAVVVGEEED